MSDAIKQQVVFNLGVLGGSKFNASMMAAIAALGVVAREMNKARKEAEIFAARWKALDDEQRNAALAMDKAGKGMVDTGVALKTVLDLTRANITPTKELTSAIGRLATVEGMKLGETYDQIQTRIARLTDSIAKGQSRALKEYGIDLENTEDLLLAQAEAMEKVIDRADGLEVQWRNIDDALAALNNDYDTMVGLAWASVSSLESVSGVLDDVHGGMGLFNDALATNQDLVFEWIKSIDFASVALGILQGDLGAVQKEIARLQARMEGFKQGKELGDTRVAQLQALGMMPGSPAAPTAPVSAPKKKKQKAGGGRRKPKLGSTEDLLASYGEVGAGVDVSWLGPGSIYADDETIDQILEGLDDLNAMIITGEEVAAYESQLRFEEAQRRKEEIYQVSQLEVMLGIDQEYVDASYDLWESSLRGKAALLETFFATGSQLMNAYNAQSVSANKVMWGYAKAMAMGQAVMKTYESAVSAYSSLVGIPYVGPILAPIAAANAIAFGIAQVRQIAATKFDPKGGASHAVSSGAGSTSAGIGGGGGGFGGGWQGGTPTINIQLGGDLGALVDKVDAVYEDKIHSGEWSPGRWGKQAA